MICFQISVGLTQKNVLSLGLTSKVFSKIIKEFSKISKKFHSFSKLLSNISCLFSFKFSPDSKSTILYRPSLHSTYFESNQNSLPDLEMSPWLELVFAPALGRLKRAFCNSSILVELSKNKLLFSSNEIQFN